MKDTNMKYLIIFTCAMMLFGSLKKPEYPCNKEIEIVAYLKGKKQFSNKGHFYYVSHANPKTYNYYRKEYDVDSITFTLNDIKRPYFR